MQNNSFVRNLLNGLNIRTQKLLQNPNKKAGLNWFKVKKLKHFTIGKIRKYNYKGRVIYYINPQDFLHGLKEIFIEEIYQLRLPSNSFIVDCGANIGLSIIYLKEKHNDAKILAFEPDKENFQLLTKNITSFNLQNVILEEKAVWINDTELNFKNDGNMSSRIELNDNLKMNTVKAIQLKKIITQNVDFLKIDIEGAEYKVLKDIEPNLHFVKNMFLEYHGSFQQNHELIEILTIIHNAKFDFYIKEATCIYDAPFLHSFSQYKKDYDIQLNIFCFKRSGNN